MFDTLIVSSILYLEKNFFRKKEQNMEFYKYHSLGNDYLIYDCNKNQEALDKEKIVKLCNRNYGIGADGIVEGPYKKRGKCM